MFDFIPEFPYHVVFLSTNRCDLFCSHCSSNSNPNELKNELSFHEVIEMINQLSNVGVFDFAISGGEPLLRKDIFEIIQYAKNLNLSVSIGSNGLKISKKKLKFLHQLNIARFQVSVDGLSNTHNQIRHNANSFDSAINTIIDAIDIGLRTNVCFTVNKLNYNELEDVIKIAIKIGVNRINISRFIPTGRGDSFLDLTNDEWKFVIENGKRMYEKYTPEIEITTHLSQLALLDYDFIQNDSFLGCQAGIGQCCISPIGDVFPCVLLPIKIGNIKDRSFKQIWESSSIVNNLKDRSSLKGKCKICSYKSKCGGCRAVSYAYSKDYLAEDTRCWYNCE